MNVSIVFVLILVTLTGDFDHSISLVSLTEWIQTGPFFFFERAEETVMGIHSSSPSVCIHIFLQGVILLLFKMIGHSPLIRAIFLSHKCKRPKPLCFLELGKIIRKPYVLSIGNLDLLKSVFVTKQKKNVNYLNVSGNRCSNKFNLETMKKIVLVQLNVLF